MNNRTDSRSPCNAWSNGKPRVIATEIKDLLRAENTEVFSTG